MTIYRSNFSKTIRDLKLKSAANVSGIELIDRKASKRDFLHVWDITGIIYLVLGGGLFILSVILLYTVLKTELNLSLVENSTDIVTLTQTTRLTTADTHYALIPPADTNIRIDLPATTGYLQGTYISVFVCTAFAAEVLDGNGDPVVDTATATIAYGGNFITLERTEGALFMVYEGQWALIRQWTVPIQNP